MSVSGRAKAGKLFREQGQSMSGAEKTDVRLDVRLVALGLCESRAKAQAAIEAGGVLVDGVVVDKPSRIVGPGAVIRVAPAHPWVSRAGVKLAAALDHFCIDPAGRVCLDLGASTGGFSEVLLARGAEHVTAVDVGRDQLHPRLRGHPRLTAFEGLDARLLRAAQLPQPPDLIVCDVSFIALAKLLPGPLALSARDADLVALIKPQFEAGREAPRDKAGLIAPELARRIAHEAAGALDGLAGFKLAGLIDSPILGGEGAVEVLAHFHRAAP
jgi:23S rRNA (cytidine1920-2'-O)/16S rRNA (cytidine1409-2'-O)-methyltransferase